MKFTKLFPVACAMFLAGTSVHAQKKKDVVTPLQDVGVVYSLPQTGVRLTVEAEETRFYHGPYHQYASSLLGLDNARSTDYIDWKICSVTFDSYSEPDPKAVFTALGWHATAISLDENGVLVGINKPVSIETSTAFTADFTNMIQAPEQVWKDRSMHSFINEDDTLSSKGWSKLSLEEKALETAHDIAKLRKRRFNALAANYDQLPPDGKAYEVMVEELTALENEYVGLFIGKKETRKHSYTFEVVPDAKGIVAFRFAQDRGVLPASDVSGRPVMMTVTPTTNMATQQVAAKTKVKGSLGFNYRIPARGVVKLQNGTTIIAQTSMIFSQLGTVVPINDELIEGNFKIEIHPNTGAIKSITPPEPIVKEEED